MHIRLVRPNHYPSPSAASNWLRKRKEMEKAVRAYAEVLRLVRRLPKDSRGYYAKYARENFVNYRDVDASDSATLHDLFQRTYNHSLWVLHKYSVDKSAADRLKGICSA